MRPVLTRGAVHADKWIPIKPNTDAALYLAIAYTWITENTYDKEYVKTHAVGTEQFFDYVMGKVDGVPKTPAWATEKCGVPEWTIKALARDWANKVTSICIGNGGPGLRGPYATEPARLQSILLGMQGLGKPGRHQAKMLEWYIHTDVFPMPYQGKARPRIVSRGEMVRPPKMRNRGAFPGVVKIKAVVLSPSHPHRVFFQKTQADLIVLNSCVVRQSADILVDRVAADTSRIRGIIRKLHRKS